MGLISAHKSREKCTSRSKTRTAAFKTPTDYDECRAIIPESNWEQRKCTELGEAGRERAVGGG